MYLYVTMITVWSWNDSHMAFGLAHFLVLDYTCFGMKFLGGPGQSLKISIFASLIVNLHIHCRNCPRRNILWSMRRRMYRTWCRDPINNSNGRSLTDNEPFDTVNEFNEYLDLPSPSSNPTRHIRVLSFKSIRPKDHKNN